MVTQEKIKGKIEELLSKEYYCSAAELNGKGTVFSVNSRAEKPYVKVLAYRKCIAVCTSEELQAKIRGLLQGKSRDEIFELPFVYGQTIHYVPDNARVGGLSALSGSPCEFLSGEEVLSLNGLTGFENSLAFDERGFTPAKAVCIARDNGRIIGVAGASASAADDVWEVGVDVVEEHRNAGLGTRLVSALTKELLSRDIVPFYSASVTNIGSQMVACRCGYVPLWVDTYGTVLDGSSVYDDIVKGLSQKL